jgi:protein-S-isoprenylcysteine O-methyltransferase Ste14
MTTTPLPFAWPFSLVYWAIHIWVFAPEMRLVRRARKSPIPTEDRGSLRVVLGLGSVAMLAAFVIPFVVPTATLPGNRFAWFFAGLIMLISGSFLRRHCFRELGRFFTGAVTIQTDHRVVDTGAYRWVRHPSYTAALLLTFGIALAMGNWLGVAVSLPIASFAYAYRARVEEQALLSALGAPYAAFTASRKRFIPFVW